MALDKLRKVRHTFMRRLRGPTILSFGHVTEGGVAAAGSNGVIIIGAGVGSDGVIGAGGWASGVRFLAFALLAGFAFFIPFFFRAGAPRYAFLDISLPSSISRIG